MIYRSMLFVPGNNMRMINKASKLEADALILDLEDAVPMNFKETARIFVRDSIKQLKSSTHAHVYVRINSLASGLFQEDLDYIICEGLDGVMIPKSEVKKDISKIDTIICEKETEIGLKKGEISLIPLVETAKGAVNAYDIASANKRIVAIGFGAVDFVADTRIQLSKDGLEILYPRSCISIAAHAAQIQPIDTPWINIQDAKGLIEDSKTARHLGFAGKMAIHPLQLEPINEVFSPSRGEIEDAKKIVKAFGEAIKSGVGAISIDGKMIDYANFRQAEEVIVLAESIEKRSR